MNSANVSEGLIILGLGSGNSRKIHIYNLNCLFDQPNKLFDAQLFSYCDALNGKVGVFPSGLPLNYKVSFKFKLFIYLIYYFIFYLFLG